MAVSCADCTHWQPTHRIPLDYPPYTRPEHWMWSGHCLHGSQRLLVRLENEPTCDLYEPRQGQER